jgi:hypothetical protein
MNIRLVLLLLVSAIGAYALLVWLNPYRNGGKK